MVCFIESEKTQRNTKEEKGRTAKEEKRSKKRKLLPFRRCQGSGWGWPRFFQPGGAIVLRCKLLQPTETLHKQQGCWSGPWRQRKTEEGHPLWITQRRERGRTHVE